MGSAAALPFKRRRSCGPYRSLRQRLQQQVYARLLLTTSNTSLDNSPELRMRSNSAFISA